MTLTDADYTAIKRLVRQDAAARAVFRAWPLAKANWKALFQAAETWFVNGFTAQPATSFKAALETVTACTNAQAQQVAWMWFGWRYTRRAG